MTQMKERAETIDYPTTAVPPASSPDAWAEVPEKVAAAIKRHPSRRYVSLWWLKSAVAGPGFEPRAVEMAAERGLIVVEVKDDLNPMGVRVARLAARENLLADWDLALEMEAARVAERARLDAAAEAIVAGMPPLTPERHERLFRIFLAAQLSRGIDGPGGDTPGGSPHGC